MIKKNNLFWKYSLEKMLMNLQYGNIEVIYPDKKSRIFRGKLDGPTVSVNFHKYTSIKKIILGGTLAFCDEYINGNITSNNIEKLIEIGSKNNSGINTEGSSILINFFKNLFNRLMHFLNFNSYSGARKNIYKHYDLGNEFYSLWLDKSLTYSSAIFDKSLTLSQGQYNKYEKLSKLINIKDGDKILEIGCGWGGFAEFISKKFDVQLTSITISKKQFDYAKKRIATAGLDDKVSIKLMDYRDLEGKYDKIISIEMFEAVGEHYWKVFFKKIKSLLKPSGIAGLQIITIKNNFFKNYKYKPDFIQKYIFPGGMLPSMEKLNEQFNSSDLQMLGCSFFGNDYAKTLSIWKKNFNNQWPQISQLGFDENFKRLWNLYFSYCEGGFRGKSIDVCQLKLISGNKE